MFHGFTTVDFQTISCLDFSVTKLVKPIGYISKYGTHYELELGQPTDFASIPCEFWGPPLFLIPTGWYSLPAMFHDGGFQNLLRVVKLDGTKELAKLTETQCNDLLLEMMQYLKPTPTLLERAQMEAIYRGVIIGGWHAFKEDRS